MIDTKALRQARKDAGLRRIEVAEATGRSVSTIRRFEAGRGYPSLETLAKLAKLYGRPVADFIMDDQAVSA